MDLLEQTRAAIYEAHGEEASFMYEQRLRYLDDPTLTFDAVAALEARLEAHVDGLVLGGAQARGLLVAALGSGEPGLTYLTLTVLCRQGERAALLAALNELDVSDPAVLQAVGDALALELPDAFHALAASELASGRPELHAAWARAAGQRRWPLGEQLLKAALAQDGQRATALACAWALGELKEAGSKTWLRTLIGRDPELSYTAALALLKLGEPLTVLEVQARARELPSWSAVPLALTDALGVSQLEAIKAHASDPCATHALLALGLHGAASALPVLVAKLADERAGSAAAAALYLITGAELLDEVVVPEAADPDIAEDLVDPDTTLAGDAESGAADPEPDEEQVPVRPTTKVQLTRDPQRWQDFLLAHPNIAEARAPLRMGQLLTVEATLLALRSLITPLALRRLLAADLQIRGGVAIRLQVDDPVHKQRAAWSAIGAAAAQTAHRQLRFKRSAS